MGEFLPVRVSTFDSLIEYGGIERGSILLVAGGCGVGKSIFCIQSLYHGALNGEKGIYIAFEEPAEKLRVHMKRNFGWDIEKMEKNGLFAIINADAFELAQSIHSALRTEKGERVFGSPGFEKMERLIRGKDIELPFKPDRVVIDPLTSLTDAFSGYTETYRGYLQYLFTKLRNYNSVNFITTETEQEINAWSKIGAEEFMCDGVIVLYNIRKEQVRQRGMEIKKLRFSNHSRRILPYEITKKGIEIFEKSEIFL